MLRTSSAQPKKLRLSTPHEIIGTSEFRGYFSWPLIWSFKKPAASAAWLGTPLECDGGLVHGCRNHFGGLMPPRAPFNWADLPKLGMFKMAKPTLPAATNLPPDLPVRADRRRLSDLLTRHRFPVAARTLERWPLTWTSVNGRALAEVAEAFAVADDMLARAPRLRTGKAQQPAAATAM